MRKYTAALLAAILLLIAVIPAAAQGTAPVVLAVELPATAAAGQPLAVAVVTEPHRPGMREAHATLVSPQGQVLQVRLLPVPGKDRMEGSVRLSYFAPSGLWTLTDLIVFDNDGRYTQDMPGDAPPRVTVNGTLWADLTPPQIHTVTMGGTNLVQGAPFTVAAVASDNLSGITGMRAAVVPDVAEPTWWEAVALQYSPAAGAWEGTAYLPFSAAPSTRIRVDWVEAYDAAGNYTYYEPAEAGTQAATTVQILPRTAEAALNTNPTLSVVHGRELHFTQWLEADRALVERYFLGVPRPVDRRVVIAELQDLAVEIRELVLEMYHNPLRGLNISPPNTTGKAWTVAAAIRARLLLLTELNRRLGLSSARPLGRDELLGVLSLESEPVTMVDPAVVASLGGAYTDFVAGALAQTRLGVIAMTAPHSGMSWEEADFLPDGLMWITPWLYGDSLAWHVDNGKEMIITMHEYHLRWPMTLVETLSHELGHHLQYAFLGPADPASPAWQEYLSLRGNQPFPAPDVGHDGLAEENFAEDMVYLFGAAPVVAQHFDANRYAEQSFPRLSEHPAMADQVLRFVVDQMVRTNLPALTVLEPEGELVIRTGQELTVRGRWAPGHQVEVWWAAAVPDELLGGAAYSTTILGTRNATVAADGTWSVRVSGLPLNTPSQVVVEAMDASGQRHRVKVFFVVAR